MIIRFRTPLGMHRKDFAGHSTVQHLIEEVSAFLKVRGTSVTLFKDQQQTCPLQPRDTLTGSNLQHGDMIWAVTSQFEKQTAQPSSITAAATLATSSSSETDLSSTSNSSSKRKAATREIVEDAVDIEVAKKDGKVPRKSAEGSKKLTVDDLPLDAFDPKILEERSLKFMSFHAYIRKLRQTAMKPSLSSHAITFPELSRHKLEHSHSSAKQASVKDMARAMTLNRPKFRFVDHLEFADAKIIDGFLDGWRQSGQQRVGWMYGTYEAYDFVPLGIKGEVQAIYEPKQEGNANSISIEDDPDLEKIDEIANALGLRRVGLIFTDLEALKGQSGKVVNSRNEHNYFLRSNEIILAAHLQNKYPSPCKLAADGVFGSKFVTAVLTGDEENNVAVQAYQVSQQAMDLEDAGMFAFSPDPKLCRVVTEKTNPNVPTVMFQQDRRLQKADPTFPPEFLLTEVSHGFPQQQDQNPSLPSRDFPPHHRHGSLSSVVAVGQHIQKVLESENPWAVCADFNFIVRAILETRMPDTEIEVLCTAVTSRDLEAVMAAMFQDSFQSAVQLANFA